MNQEILIALSSTLKFILVKLPLIILTPLLIAAGVVLYLQYGADSSDTYAARLAQLYNDTQGGTNDYLDQLHVKISCCGVSGMQLNTDSDPTDFRIPSRDVFSKLPQSCCASLDENERCTYDRIYLNTCDAEYAGRLTVFNVVVSTFLFVSLIWKIIQARKIIKTNLEPLWNSNLS